MTPEEYNEKKKARIEHLKNLAEKNKAAAKKILAEARNMASAIPFGQPILIGHHSEKSDRNYRNRIHSKFGKALELEDKAEYFEKKAKFVENNDNIYSDDPEAIEKLKLKIKNLEDSQEKMKNANKIIRRNIPHEDKVKLLIELGIKEKTVEYILSPNWYGGTGYQQFQLANNNSNIHRLKKRLEYLQQQKSKQSSETEINGIKIVENVELNRLQIFFPDIPSQEVRKELKSNGFRWSPTNKCWQHHLSNVAKIKADKILNKYYN